MGNRSAGTAMCIGAAAVIDALGGIGNITQEQALKSLDIICEPWRGADVEFDEGADPDGPLGMLTAKAFGLGDDWVARLSVANSLESSEEFAGVGCEDEVPVQPSTVFQKTHMPFCKDKTAALEWFTKIMEESAFAHSSANGEFSATPSEDDEKFVMHVQESIAKFKSIIGLE